VRWERGNERTRHHDLRRTNYDSGTGHHHDDYDYDDSACRYATESDCGRHQRLLAECQIVLECSP